MSLRTIGTAMSAAVLVAAPVGPAGGQTTPSCFGRPATIILESLPGENEEIGGTKGADVIVGGAGDDIIYGLEGHDRICGRGGSDTLYGWRGDDRLSGGGGSDRLYGEKGNDVLEGGQARDLLAGDVGRDVLRGGPGEDSADFGQENLKGPITVNLAAGRATGAGGPDILARRTIEHVRMNCSAEENDVLIGDGRANTLQGGSGADVIRGRGGPDTLYGGDLTQISSDAGCTDDDGPDVLFGGTGNDRMYGQLNDDTLDGEAGTDALDGGFGTDACMNGESLKACET
jgi:Ca2+-binding RTX toxin-like protein